MRTRHNYDMPFVLSSLVSAPAITLGVYDLAQTMTGKPLAYEEVFVDQRSAKGWVGTNKQSVYDFATAAWAKGLGQARTEGQSDERRAA